MTFGTGPDMLKNGLLPEGCSNFQTEVAAAEKALSPMVARTVREMASAVDDEERSRRRVQTSETRCSCLDR